MSNVFRYIRLIVAEALRLYPQPPLLIRRAIKPDVLPGISHFPTKFGSMHTHILLISSLFFLSFPAVINLNFGLFKESSCLHWGSMIKGPR